MGEGQQYADPDHHDIRNVHPVNAPYQEVQRAAAEAQAVAAGGPTTNEIAEKTGLNEEKKDEEGGKKYAAPATAHDRGARELGGEAGGTHTSPGPRADVVQTAIMAQMGKAQGVQVDGAVQLPDDHLKGQQQHWSVEQAMEPHLQLMYVGESREARETQHTDASQVWPHAVVLHDRGRRLAWRSYGRHRRRVSSSCCAGLRS
jgi:hypothetical protein